LKEQLETKIKELKESKRGMRQKFERKIR